MYQVVVVVKMLLTYCSGGSCDLYWVVDLLPICRQMYYILKEL